MQKTFNFFYAFILAILGVGATLMAEDITLTTYYPAPYGAYDELSTTGDTYLATTSGNVGIGTTVPLERLHIYDTIDYQQIRFEQDLTGTIHDGTWDVGVGVGGTFTFNGVNNNIVNIDKNAASDSLKIDSDSEVGIGITTPTAKLHVNGNIKAVLADIDGGAPANMRYNSGTNNIGFDVAELFDASEEVEPGDLLAIDETKSVQLRKSVRPYEKAIIGVVSGSPAILFEGSQLEIAPAPGGFIKGAKPPVALVGRIQCKVTLENGPIERGDFLTSSSMPGHAMKATDRERSFGAIVGKSLESFDGGTNGEKTGKIIVLIALQ